MMDAAYHHEWAKSIAQGDWLGKESFFRAPFYPYFLGIVYAICGANLIAPRILQVILGALSCLLIYKIGTLVFDKKVGLVAAWIAVFYPLFIYFDNELLIPTLLVFLVLSGFYLIIRQREQNGAPKYWFSTGLVWGVAAITRPNVLAFLVFLPLWLKQQVKTRFLKIALYGALGVLAMILPITIRNYVVGKEFVPIAWQGGVNFYIGNNPHSDGKTAIVPGTRKSWYGGFADAKRLAEEQAGRTLSNSEIDNYWLREGMKFILGSPSAALILFLKKVYLYCGGYEISNNRDIYFFTRPTFLKFIFFKTSFFQFPFGVLLPLSIVGIYLALRNRKKILLMLYFIVLYSLSIIVFFVTARYRMPVVPFLIILSAYGIMESINYIRKSGLQYYTTPLVIFVAAFILFNINLTRIKDNPELNYLTLASLEFDRGNYQKTISYASKAMPLYSRDVEVLNLLGTSYLRMGKLKEAHQYYLEMTNITPNSPEPYDRLGVVFYMSQQFDKAKACYFKALTIDPKYAPAYLNGGHVFYIQDSLEKALLSYETALSLDPKLTDAFYYAALTALKLGNVEKGKLYLQKTLQLDPQHAYARKTLNSLPRE
jgi:4-amino-4-deoxy-L-arabinose transferase-like glycosyltransferase